MNNSRPATRTRAGPQRIKIHADENIATRRDPHASTLSAASAASAAASIKAAALAATNATLATAAARRSALGEISNAHRKAGSAGGADINKENKTRARSASVNTSTTSTTTSARVVVGQPRAASKGPSATRHRQSASSTAAAVVFRPAQHRAREEDEAEVELTASVRKRMRSAPAVVPEVDDVMEISEDESEATPCPIAVTQEEAIVEDVVPAREESPPVEDLPYDRDDWTRAPPATEAMYKEQVERVQATFKDEPDDWDMTMVSEYSDDIFEYMKKLEVESMPDANYMEKQSEIQWHMRATLIDWLLQVHLRYHMLPETLWIAVNIVDRFLSKRTVSLVKLQLVGVTAMFIAAKYEEIVAPSVTEFVHMTENGYTREEILKGERIILQSLNFSVSSYCSPYSWVRRISKADDYDLQTRTLSKFLMEVTLLDHRFLRAKPSLIAAIGMYTARKMLGGDWNEAFIFYSSFVEDQLVQGHAYLIETLASPDFGEQYVFRKYANKKFLKASIFAKQWACEQWPSIAQSMNAMILDGAGQ